MKIMLVTPYFYPKIGGLENYAFNTAKGLLSEGHEVFVVTSNHVAKRHTEEIVEGIRVIRLPISFVLSNSPFGLTWRRQLKQIVKVEKPSIINAHAPVPGMADIAFLARKHTRFIITYHAGSLKKGSPALDTILGLYERTFLKHMFKKADKVISVYPAFIDKLVKHEQSSVHIPPGVDTNIFKPGKKKDAHTVLFVGRVEHSSSWKGLHILLEAMREVIAKNNAVRLHVVGGGDALGYYQEQVKILGIADNVDFSGPLTGKELVSTYQKSSLLVLPSLTDAESFGIVLIEAMACATPVLGSQIGGIPDVIDKNKTGQLFEAGSVKELADTISLMLSSPKLLSRLGANGRHRAIKHFSIEKQIAATDELFKAVAKPRVLLIHNIISPYRLPVFEELNKKVSITVLFCKSITKDRVWSYDLNNYTFERKVLKGKTLGPLIINLNALKHILKSRFDVLVCNNDPDVATAVLPAIVVAKLRGAKIVDWSEVVNENVDTLNTFAASSGRWRRTVVSVVKSSVSNYRKLVVRAAQYHIAFSEGTKKLLLKYGVQSASITRQRLVMPAQLLPAARKTSYRKRNGKRILYLGYLNDRKGVNYLIEAFKQINDVEAELVIAGSGASEKKLRKLAAGDGRIQFHGYVEGRKKASLYAKCDIFALPTNSDVWGLVINEAIHYGMAVLCSDAAEAKEIVSKQSGIIFKSRDVESLKEAIEKLLSDSSLTQEMQRYNSERKDISDPKEMSNGLLWAIEQAAIQ